MNPQHTSSPPPKLFEFLEALCEDRLTPADTQRLERLVLRDVTARRVYLEYLDLHGTLHWNAAYGPDGANFEPAVAARAADISDEKTERSPRKRRALGWWITAASVALVATLSFALGRWFSPPSDVHSITARPRDTTHPPTVDTPRQDEISTAVSRRDGIAAQDTEAVPNRPVVISPRLDSSDSLGDNPRKDLSVANNTPAIDPPAPSDGSSGNRPRRIVGSTSAGAGTSGSVAGVVAVINEHLAAGWTLYGVEPSPLADDAEWLRRVYLDVVGHIPPVDMAERFLSNRDARKREKLVDTLLDDPAYVRNWTIVWTNLLIGRSDARDVDRSALQKFLRESFGRNRPWNEMVAEFISAEGDAEKNGAANFLLAHLNNDAMPATAITSRVFMGRQIACTQCHDHPFNDWKQETFWSFHSFFEQTDVTHAERRDENSGKPPHKTSELQTKPVGGPTHFETRRGLAQVAFPSFEGIKVSDDADTNRRRELSKLMTSGEKPLIAEALVNRMWEHFFGFAFTRPVDDMGPHNAPSHPELLDHLAREFVASGYDLKQLMRWICLSDAYQRTSRFGQSNVHDDPATGTQPLFSRVYLKGMTAEQLYDSLLLATGADKTPLESGDHDRRRHVWLQQFVQAFQTDENDESVTFDSSITQALLMMNSDLTRQALSLDRGTLLEKVVSSRDAETDKLKRLCLATLTRYPTPKELQVLRKLIHDGGPAGTRPNFAGWQDALWAYLNSSEFVLVH